MQENMNVDKLECHIKTENILITTMTFTPDQKISDGISYLRNVFQKILQDSKNKENVIPNEAASRKINRKRTRGGTRVNYAALLGKRTANIKQEITVPKYACMNAIHDDDTRSCVHKRQNMIKECDLPVPNAAAFRPTKPDTSVYDFAAEWNPDSNRRNNNNATIEMDQANERTDPAQMRDYHYAELLETPVSHRMGRTETQKYFSSCLSSEKIRLTCIEQVAQTLRHESRGNFENNKQTTRHGDDRKSRLEKLAGVTSDAEKVVDDLIYLRELLEASESIRNQIEVMNRAFEERGVGPAPNQTDPLLLALELKSRLATEYQPITDVVIHDDGQ